MGIEQVYSDAASLSRNAYSKATRARATAKIAFKAGNKAKHDKFNAIARVYEMQHEELSELANDLFLCTPEAFQESITCPF